MVFEQLDLRHDLVREGSTHHERGMAGSATKIHEATFGKDCQTFPIRPFHLVDLRFNVDAFQAFIFEHAGDINLKVEVADVCNDYLVFHSVEMLPAYGIISPQRCEPGFRKMNRRTAASPSPHCMP